MSNEAYENFNDPLFVRAEALLLLIDIYEFEAKYEPDFKQALDKLMETMIQRTEAQTRRPKMRPTYEPELMTIAVGFFCLCVVGIVNQGLSIVLNILQLLGTE